jgi:hypothetical protein
MKASPEMTVAQAFSCSDYHWPKAMRGEPQERIDALVAHFADTPLGAIGLAEVEAYQTQRRMKRVDASTINEECSALLAVLLSGKLLSAELEDGYTPFASVLDVTPIDDGTNSGLDDMGRLFAERDAVSITDERTLNCCCVILGTAALWEELRLMRREHINLDGCTITVPAYRCVPERTMPIKRCDKFPDPLIALQRLLDRGAEMGATQPNDYLLPFAVKGFIRSYPLKKIWAGLRETAKVSGLWWHEKLRYEMRAWALVRWPEIAATAGPGPDEYCGGMLAMSANEHCGWKGYYPMPGTVRARIPGTYKLDDPGNLFFDEATKAKARQWNAQYEGPHQQALAQLEKSRQTVIAPVRQEPVIPPVPVVAQPAVTHTLPTAGKIYGAAKEVNAAIGGGMVSVKSLIKRLQKAGLSADVILGILSDEGE